MKPVATDENRKTENKVFWVIAVLCLIYGGVAFILFLNQFHFFYERSIERPQFNLTNNTAIFGGVIQNNTALPPAAPGRSGGRSGALVELLIGSTLIGSLISIGAGISLLMLLRKREHKDLRTQVVDSLILPDEKLVLRELERQGGEATQTDLVRSTGLSKVKVHRVIKRLESMDLVSKHPYGLTNKIRSKGKLH